MELVDTTDLKSVDFLSCRFESGSGHQITFLLMDFKEHSIESLEKQASSLACGVVEPVIILLWGSVGAGKTTFARSFIRSYYENESLKVVSPTFSIVQNYFGCDECKKQQKLDIWHLDLYRIENDQELFELGIEEAIGHSIVIIEWPEKIIEFLKDQKTINIHINVTSDSTRSITIK